MIIEKIVAQEGSRSAKNLVDYITQDHKAQNITISNISDGIISTQDAVAYIENVQCRNTRSKSDKNYHFVMSFPVGERPSDQDLKEMEEVVVSQLGFGGHQRISAQHIDTDHFHVHVMVNKIDPITYKNITPKSDYAILTEASRSFEKKYDLTRVDDKRSLDRKLNKKISNQYRHYKESKSLEVQALSKFSKSKVEDIKNKYANQRALIRYQLNQKNSARKREELMLMFKLLFKQQQAEYDNLFRAVTNEKEKIKNNTDSWKTFSSKEKFKAMESLERNKTDGRIFGSGQIDSVSLKSVKKYTDYSQKSVVCVDNVFIKDDSNSKYVELNNSKSKVAIEHGLDVVINKYGNKLTLDGNNKFINNVLDVIANNNKFNQVTIQDPNVNEILNLKREIKDDNRKPRTRDARVVGKNLEKQGRIAQFNRSSRVRELARHFIKFISGGGINSAIGATESEGERDRESIRPNGGQSTSSNGVNREWSIRRNIIRNSLRRELEKAKRSDSEFTEEKYSPENPRFREYLSSVPRIGLVHGWTAESQVLLSSDENSKLGLFSETTNGNQGMRRTRDLDRTDGEVSTELMDYLNERNEKRARIPTIKEHAIFAETNGETVKLLGVRENGKLLLLERQGEPNVIYLLTANSEYAFKRCKELKRNSNIKIHKDLSVEIKQSIKKGRKK